MMFPSLRPRVGFYLRLLGVVVRLTPLVWFAYGEWHGEAGICDREFALGSEFHDACRALEGDPGALCTNLAHNPFECSERFIAGESDRLSERDVGPNRGRRECAGENDVVHCSSAQWQAWCSASYGPYDSATQEQDYGAGERARRAARCVAAGSG